MFRLQLKYALILFSEICLAITGCTKDTSPVAPEPEPQPTVDHVAPTVEWIEPQGGADLSGTVELVFSVYDENSIDRVVIYRNGSQFGWGGHSCLPENRNISETDDTLYTFEWDTRTEGDDVYILEARAWDEAGNLGISPSLMVRVKNDSVPPPEDRTPPVVVWCSPQPGSEIAGTVELRFDALDNVAIDSLKVYLNGYCPGGFMLPGHPEAEYSVTWVTDSLVDGSYIIEVLAWDSSGNEGGCPSLLLRVKNSSDPPPEDRTPPDVWWTAPDGGSTLTDSVLFQFRAFDEGTVTYVQLYMNGASPEGARIPGRPDNEYGFWWNTLNDSDGVYIWEARAWDEAGNLGVSPSLLVRVRNNEEPPPEDHTPPVVTWLSPEPDSEVMGTVTLRFQVMDDDAVDSVKVYLNGAVPVGFALEGREDIFYSVLWITNSYEDGSYNIEVRAQDRSGNIGTAPSVILHVLNNRPRVIWVRDDYETIQDAIWHSEDGDTVRVRPGIYCERVDFWNKNIWLESEDGPEITIIDGMDSYFGIYANGDQDTTSGIRGFTIRNTGIGICLSRYVSLKIFNNIVISSTDYNLFTSTNMSVIRNNIFSTAETNVCLQISYGEFDNNVVIHAERFALWNVYIHENPIVPDYNLIWDYQWLTNDPPIRLGEHNIIDQDPMFEEGSFILREDSPCIDTGHPNLLDLDGSRSDIGVYGGPYAYPEPN